MHERRPESAYPRVVTNTVIAVVLKAARSRWAAPRGVADLPNVYQRTVSLPPGAICSPIVLRCSLSLQGIINILALPSGTQSYLASRVNKPSGFLLASVWHYCT